MSNSSDDLEKISKLSKLLKRKRSKYWYAEKMGIPVEEVLKLKNRIYNEKNRIVNGKEEALWKENIEKGTIESVKTVSFEPRDHKELAKLHKIDLNKFVITNYWSKLQPNGNFTSSVFCKRKQKADFSMEDFENMLKDYKPNYIPYNSIPNNPEKSTIDLEISISDFHLAKKYITEHSANVHKRAKVFQLILETLVIKAASMYNIDNIIFPIANDFFHTDTYWNTTTNGTPQTVIAEYDEEYEVGFDLLVKSLLFLKNMCNTVTVVLVQGNHDKTKSFYLAHGLEVYFRNDKQIKWLRGTEPVKAIKIGETFIGYHHGNCKIDELPLIFATTPECSEAFGKAKYREVHTGDKHHYMAKEVKGVRIQQMPSLSGVDKWHRENNYVNNIRAALVLLYDKEKGKIGELEERI